MATTIEETKPVIEKISDTELRISRTRTTTSVEEQSIISNYTKDFLLKQIEQINAQRDGFKASLEAQLADNEAKRSAEIAECELLLAECDKAGIMTAAEYAARVEAEEPVEPVEEPIEP